MKGLFLFCIISAASVFSYAQEQQETVRATAPVVERPPLLKRLTFQANARVLNMKYEEPGLMKDSGVLSGAALGVQYRANSKFLFIGSGEYYAGTTTYDGSIGNEDGYRPITQKSKNSIVQLRGLAAWNLSSEQLVRGPYAGLGYWRLTNLPHGLGTYYRSTQYVYIPIGFMWSIATGPASRLLFTGEYDLFVQGENESRLSPYGYRDVKMAQNSGYGLRASGEWQMALTQTVDMSVELFAQHWDIEASEFADGGITRPAFFIEPKNQNTLIGLGLGFII